MAQVLGLLQVVWNGTQIKVEKGSKVKLGGLVQKGVVTGSQVDFATEFEMSEVTATTVMQKGTALLGLFTPGQGELQVLCDTGQTYAFGDAFLANRPEFTGGDGGKVPLKWNASNPVELVQ
jgi:hypothetical protein